MPSDRRQFDRYPFSSRLEVVTHSAGARLAADAIDVSVGGFGFRATSPFEPGEVISVSMPEMQVALEEADEPHEFPDLQSLRILAIVRHVAPAVGGGWVVGAERHA